MRNDDLVQRALLLLTHPIGRGQTIAASAQQPALDQAPKDSTVHPGEPIEAQRTGTDWRAAWRELAASTSGIESRDDPRYDKVMRWIDAATVAEMLDCWPAFCEAAQQIKIIMRAES
ncbi:MAG: hypothetical protein ND866_08035 [Pyrinomonadaceae bacterium]|nr:hypothetical protein [Pyrinomonadaceae bacterium]